MIITKTVHVETASKTYDVVFGHGILDEAGNIVASAIPVSAVAIVTDSNVDSLYSERLAASLIRTGFKVVKFVFPAGEKSKNSETYVSLLEFLAENNLTRSDAVFALGGGVAGDLAGFAAATYLRGIRFVQLPTTLLAAVDSSVGGKTGIDLKSGKNLAGSFYQPDIVLCDVSALDTLSGEQLADGWAEIIKYGMICDRQLLDTIKCRNQECLEDIIIRCVQIKRDIVGIDERENGPRKLLNFGHTVGHAIEKCSNYEVSHGRAVAVGMAVITRAAVKMGFCGEECLDILNELLRLYKLPDMTEFREAGLFEAMLSDKKREAEGLTLIVPESAGICVMKTVTMGEARELLRLGLPPLKTNEVDI